MPVPLVYATGADKPAIEFTWIDYLSNIAYGRFYANISRITDTTTFLYYLTPTRTDAKPMLFTNNTDKDFDFTMKVPVVIQAADAVFNFTHRVGATQTSQVQITVYHVNAAAVETSIGTAITAQAASAAARYIRENIKITLTQKSFAVGEKLRINVITTGAPADQNKWVYADAGSKLTVVDEDGRTVNTDFTCDIPFKIQS